MDKLPVNALEVVFPRVVASVDAWIEANTQQAIQADVFRQLDKAQEEVVRKLLGFNKDYKGWGLDHCNGRAGESAAGKHLYESNKAAVDAWLAQVKVPTMSTEFKEKLEKEMQSKFEATLLRRVGEVAQAAAEGVLAEFKTSICKTDVVEKFFKAQKLILGDQE